MDKSEVFIHESSLSGSISDIGSHDIKEREGGTEAWRTVAGSVLVYYSSYGIINSFGFFQHYYHQDFLAKSSPSTISLIGTLQILLMNSVAPLTGAICDLYGHKKLYLVSGIGTASSLLLLSLTRPGAIWQVFLIQGLFMGVTIALGVQPALTVAGQHFRRKRALAMGIAASGCSLGGTFFPIMFARLLPIVGFAWSLRVAALKTLICYLVALGISTSKPTGKALGSGLGVLLDYHGLLDLRYSVLCIGAWIVQLGISVPAYYIESFCLTVFPTSNLGSYLLSLNNGCGLFGMVLGGLIGDHIGRLNLLYPSLFVCGFLCLTLWLFTPSIAALVSFTCLYGFCSGVYNALLPSVVSQISPDEKIGARIGAFYCVIAVAGLIGSPIAGALLQGEGRAGYQQLIVYSGATLTGGGIIILIARMLHDRNLRTKW